MLFLCSPGNPTGAVASLDYLKRALELADRHDFIVASDECYSEIYLDESQPPPGLLQAAIAVGHSAFERCVVFHSLSKRSSVPGLRSGFVAGDAALIKPFLLYRTYHGCAMPLPTQLASIPAWNDDAHVVENRRLYRAEIRSDAADPAGSDGSRCARRQLLPLAAASLTTNASPANCSSRQHVTILPGSYIARDSQDGNPGRGRVRISLVATVPECIEAAERIRDYALTR